MTATEVAWAAGFFDGEGTTHVSVSGDAHQLYVSLQQSELSTLERLQDALGVGGIYALTPRVGLAKKPQFRWQVGRRLDAMFAIGLMWPYLSGPKREQARQAMSVMREADKKRAARAATRAAQSTPQGAL